MNTLQDDYSYAHRRAPRSLHVVVAGAGISGLSAGVALAQTGHSVTILESVSEIAEVGAGIQLAPNASRILNRLGVLEEVMEYATTLSRISIRRYDSDEELSSAPNMPALGHKYGAPMSVIHRGDLQRVLLGAAVKSGCRILTSHTVVAADPDFEPRVLARDNTTGQSKWIQGDVVIAADGMKSSLRRQMALASGCNDMPVPTGDAAYRLLIPREKVQDDASLLEMLDSVVGMRYMGPGGHIMAYPVRNNTLYNIVLLHPDKTAATNLSSSHHAGKSSSVPSVPSEGCTCWTNKGSRTEMRDFYRAWSPKIQAWLDQVDQDDQILEWKLYSHPAPLPTWVCGAIALAGDACHPMLLDSSEVKSKSVITCHRQNKVLTTSSWKKVLPYVAQGAANGMEDAGVLAAAFTCTADVTVALRVYEAVRKERAERIAASAEETRLFLHLPDGAAQRTRDEGIRSGTGTGDRWCDPEWHDYVWGVDVMRETVERWDELVGGVACKSGLGGGGGGGDEGVGELDVVSVEKLYEGVLTWLRRFVSSWLY